MHILKYIWYYFYLFGKEKKIKYIPMDENYLQLYYIFILLF